MHPDHVSPLRRRGPRTRSYMDPGGWRVVVVGGDLRNMSQEIQMKPFSAPHGKVLHLWTSPSTARGVNKIPHPLAPGAKPLT